MSERRKTEKNVKHNDVKNWRLDFIKQRHREVILSARGELSSGDLDIEKEYDVPEWDGADELESLGLDTEYELDIGY